MIQKYPVTSFLLLFTLFTLILFWLLPYNSVFVEKYYYQGMFKGFRGIWTLLLSWIPVAIIHIAGAFLLVWLAYGSIKHRWWTGIKKVKISTAIMAMVRTSCVIILLFYWLWGFNYKRPDVVRAMAADSPPLTVDGLFEELDFVTRKMDSLRRMVPEDLSHYPYSHVEEKILRSDLFKVMRFMGQDVFGRVRVRLLYPKGSLLHWSTAGVYLPFLTEGHIDPGLHGITWPFTITHEMAHGHGVTGEDSCNFWAFLACVNSENTVHQYSGYFGYWRYLCSNARLADPKRFQLYWDKLPDSILKDISEVVAYSERYPDILPVLRDLIYDNYLKSHGIPHGLKSYNQMIVSVHAWKETFGSIYLSEIDQSERPFLSQ